MFFKKKNKGRFKKGHIPWNKGKKLFAKQVVIQDKHAIDTYGKPFIKLFAIGDLHWDEGLNKCINYKPTINFLKYWGPVDVLIFAGDMWDLSYLSHWNSDRFDDIGHNQIAKLIQKEAIGMRKVLKEFIDVAKPKRIIYIEGNHEDWLPQYLNKYDKVHSTLGKNSLKDWLGFDELGIEEVKLHESFIIGHMTFKHGDTYGTGNPAKRAIERSHRSMFFWHHHKFISWPGYTDADEYEKIQAYAIPGFCKASAMEYMRKAPNNWSCGFLLSYIKPSGKFTPHIQVVSPSGNFMYNDKEFE